MKRKSKGAVIAVAGVAALAGGAAAVAGATGGGGEDEHSKAITGSALERASAVALQKTGGGRVTETEVGDEEGAYEVEVTRADGSQVDVHLNRDFKVIDASADGEQGDDNDGQGDAN